MGVQLVPDDADGRTDVGTFRYATPTASQTSP